MSPRGTARRADALRAFPPARLEPIDPAARALARSVRGWLAELLTFWPSRRRREMVLWVRVTDGETRAGARTRAAATLHEGPIAQEVRAIVDDVPVVVELADGRTVVARWRAVIGEG